MTTAEMILGSLAALSIVTMLSSLVAAIVFPKTTVGQTTLLGYWSLKQVLTGKKGFYGYVNFLAMTAMNLGGSFALIWWLAPGVMWIMWIDVAVFFIVMFAAVTVKNHGPKEDNLFYPLT